MKQTQGNNGNKKFGMAINLDLCTGCGSCMVACMARYLLFTQALHALRRPRRSRPFTLCFRLSGRCNRLQHGNRHRQPDLYPLFRLPVLYGCLPLSCQIFQLVGSGMARRDGEISESQCLGSHERCGGKMQLLFSSVSTGHGQSISGRPTGA